MCPIYLQHIEQRANVQFRIMEAKSNYVRLADDIYNLAIDVKEKQRHIGDLTDFYYKILKSLFMEEILLNKQLN